MSYRKSYMGANDRFIGDIGGDAARRQRDEEARERQQAAAYEDERDIRCVDGDVSLPTVLTGAVAILAFLPGGVLGVWLFLKLIGSVTESWQVLGLPVAFFVGGFALTALAAFVSAFVLELVGVALRYSLAGLAGGLKWLLHSALRAVRA